MKSHLASLALVLGSSGSNPAAAARSPPSQAATKSNLTASTPVGGLGVFAEIEVEGIKGQVADDDDSTGALAVLPLLRAEVSLLHGAAAAGVTTPTPTPFTVRTTPNGTVHHVQEWAAAALPAVDYSDDDGVPLLPLLDRADPAAKVLWYTPLGWFASYERPGPTQTTDAEGNPVDPTASPTESADAGAPAAAAGGSSHAALVVAFAALLLLEGGAGR